MKTKIRYLTIIFACLAIGLATYGCSNKELNQEMESLQKNVQQMQATAQRALDMLEVEKVMSKHNDIGDNIKELETIWVSPDGPYGKTAKWTSPMGIWEGMELLMRYYGTDSRDSKKKNLEAINELYPEIEVKPENYGVGSWSGGNNPTNPIIEIAGDGKTAKAKWDSNGPGMSSRVRDGELVVSGTWYWRTYFVDFVKEDGQWKFWHMNITYDIYPSIGAEYGSDWTKWRPREMKGGVDPSDPSGPTRPNPNPYQEWSPLRLPQTQAQPKLPEPYYTFSETFSY